MRRWLCLLLLPNLLVTPALCMAHALHDHTGEQGAGSVPHFHAHHLFFGFPDEEDEQGQEQEHDADAVPAPDLVAVRSKPAPPPDAPPTAPLLLERPILLPVETSSAFVAESPPPRSVPVYLST